MFPHCEAFFKTYRLTGRSQVPKSSQAMNVIPGTSSPMLGESKAANGLGSLEEIAEVEEETEHKRGKCQN
jgi:hypothetical protein